jgi:transposase
LQANKTDDNDAFGGALRLVPACPGQEPRESSSARHADGSRQALTNTIRGLCKTFDVVLGPGRNSSFTNQVRDVLTRQPELSSCIEPLLLAWEVIRTQMASLEKQLARHARHNAVQAMIDPQGLAPP